MAQRGAAASKNQRQPVLRHEKNVGYGGHAARAKQACVSAAKRSVYAGKQQQPAATGGVAQAKGEVLVVVGCGCGCGRRRGVRAGARAACAFNVVAALQGTAQRSVRQVYVAWVNATAPRSSACLREARITCMGGKMVLAAR